VCNFTYTNNFCSRKLKRNYMWEYAKNWGCVPLLLTASSGDECWLGGRATSTDILRNSRHINHRRNLKSDMACWKRPMNCNIFITDKGTRVKMRTINLEYMKMKTSKDIPVKVRGGRKGCEASRISHFLDNRLTDSSEVINFKLRRRFTPRKFPST
jgi:hypothetical protein